MSFLLGMCLFSYPLGVCSALTIHCSIASGSFRSLHVFTSGISRWIVDWKTNRRGAGEDDAALLRRLASEYERQLGAYGACSAAFFPGCAVRLWVYSTVAGRWSGVGPGT